MAIAVPHGALAQAALQASDPRTDVASYQLAATLDPSSRQVHGSGRITYRNLSEDTIHEVWLRLYLNAFRSGDTMWMREAGGTFRVQGFDPAHPGWIRVERLALADTGVVLPLPGDGDTEETIVRVPLPDPLPPAGTLHLDVRWTSQLPRVFARTGFSDDFFMVAQWYPKLAVYDRGQWDTEPWHANSEFFADFGTYDLAITVPARYVTGASGVRLSESTDPDGTKTVVYRAERVTDVAWTAWPDFVVLGREVRAAGVPVWVELLLPPEEQHAAERHLAAAGVALDWYGRWYGPYPWPKLTVVVPPAGAEGAGGMEYPSLVATGRSLYLPFRLGERVHDVEVVTLHEIAHQWFPMQVQSNEARDPWLDEGFADYMTIRLLDRLYGRDRSLLDLPFARLGYASVHRASFVAAAARQPLAQPAWGFPDQLLYAATAYSKGSLALLSLERTLGEERFTSALRAYADRWRWRHPTIADFQAALEESTGESLDWFFRPLVYGTGVVDYQVTSLDGGRAVVDRRGDVSYPVDVRVTFDDGTSRTERWDGRSDRLELGGGGLAVVAVAVDPEERIAIQLDRLNDARTQRPDPVAPLAIADRWLTIVQAVLQLLGQIG